MADNTTDTNVQDASASQAPVTQMDASQMATVKQPQAIPDQQSAPDVAAPSMADVLSGGNAQPAMPNLTAATPTVPMLKKPSAWQNILTGALVGLAGGVGAQNFGEGLSGGARASLGYQQQQTENRMQQDKQAAQIRFQTAEDAYRAAALANQDKQLHLQEQDQQDRHDANTLNLMKMNQELFGTQYEAVPNTGQNAMNYLTQGTANATAAGQNGVAVPAGTLLTTHTMYVPKQGTNNLDVQYKQATTLATALGVPAPTQQQFNMAGTSGRGQLIERMQNQLMGNDPGTMEPYSAAKLPLVISAMKTNATRYAKDPQHDQQVLTMMNSTLDKLQTQLKANNDNEASAAGQKAAAEAKARMPFERALAQMQQAMKDGDPQSAGQMLAQRLIAPSQIISARNPKFAQQAFAAAHKIDPSYNAQKAEGDFKVASSPSNVQFFGSAKSLTDQGGTLDQLAAQHAQLGNTKIPVFNSWKDYASYQTGDAAMAGFMQTAIGVADDYAKVMGGGTGSDTSRIQVMKSFANAHNPAQMAAAISAARNAVNSQMDSRIGNNTVMRAMYGDGVQTSKTNPAGQGQPQQQQQNADPFAKFGGRKR